MELPFTNSDEFVEDQIKAFGVKGQVGPNGGAWGCVVDGMLIAAESQEWLR